MSRHLRILHRAGCHLCNEMLERVRILCEGHAVTIETMDVDKDPELDAEYGKDVPVLFADGTEICRHRLDEAELEDFFANT
ncbi:MAG: glutaredoxin family protein [Gammaproteobacteria bacterium]